MMAYENDKKPGSRARKTKQRNDAIRRAAMALARRRKWPSPPAIADKTGISESVIERETALLLDARREWEKVTGQKHPQWRDPEGIAQNGAASTKDKASQQVTDPVKASADQIKRHKAIISKQKETIFDLKETVVELEEQVRRLLLRVRPPELELILEAGAPKRLMSKSKKRVRVRS
jgi:hypothetical protein